MNSHVDRYSPDEFLAGFREIAGLASYNGGFDSLWVDLRGTGRKKLRFAVRDYVFTVVDRAPAEERAAKLKRAVWTLKQLLTGLKKGSKASLPPPAGSSSASAAPVAASPLPPAVNSSSSAPPASASGLDRFEFVRCFNAAEVSQKAGSWLDTLCDCAPFSFRRISDACAKRSRMTEGRRRAFIEFSILLLYVASGLDPGFTEESSRPSSLCLR